MTVLHAERIQSGDLPHSVQTSTLFVSYCILASQNSACFKSYKATEGSTCVSILRPVVALDVASRHIDTHTYTHDHVDDNFIIGRNTAHDDSKKPVTSHAWLCRRYPALSESLEITVCSPLYDKSLEITIMHYPCLTSL